VKRQSLRTLLGILVWAVLFGHSAGYYSIGLIDRMDAVAYDATLRLTAPGGIDDRVVIVDIDERSLEEVGRWPWRRDRLAELIDRIFDRHGALLLGLDVILAEPDESSGLAVLEGLAAGPLHADSGFQAALAAIRPRLDFDQRLADAIARHPVVLAYHLNGQGNAHEGPARDAMPRSVLPADALGAAAALLPEWAGYKSSLPVFQQAALGAGHINGMPDFDGVVRRVPLLVKVAGQYQEALGLAMVRVLAANAAVRPLFSSGTSARTDLEGLILETPKGALRIPVDAEARALIPYRGAAGSFNYVSAADVLADRLLEGALRKRIVLLGTTAPGLVDLRVVPVGSAFPGVEIHANLVSGILGGRLKAMPGYVAGLQLVLLALIGLTMMALLPGRSPRRISQVTALLVASMVGLGVWMWHSLDIVLPLAAPLVLVALLYALNMIFGYFLEVHNRRSMARLFGQYVPPELVREMSRDPDRYGMEGRNAELSVLFADIRGFTALSEGMPPQELARMTNEFFSAMAAVVREHRGTLDKYLGDAVMAFWGAPVADAQHANHAVAAGLAMQARLAAINEIFPQRGWPRLAIGIGINTGDMTVGDMGSSDRRAYTVLGDPVNLAARLVDLTAYYGAAIVIGEATRRALDGVVCRELDRVTVQGRAGAVTLYEPLGPPAAIDPALEAELARWRDVLAWYRARQWEAAEEALRHLADRTPRRLYGLYLERIARIRAESVLEDWDGVWHFGRRAD
jgi:adenylate cyclase